MNEGMEYRGGKLKEIALLGFNVVTDAILLQKVGEWNKLAHENSFHGGPHSTLCLLHSG